MCAEGGTPPGAEIAIMECEEAGYDLDRFVRIALDAMKGIAGDIGL